MTVARQGDRSGTAVTLGVAIICLGVLCNEWIVARTFSPDGILQGRTLLYVRGFNLLCVAFGAAVIAARRRHNAADALATVGARFPRLTALFMGCFMAVIAFALIEATFYSLNGRRRLAHEIRQSYIGDLHHYDPLLGFRAAPNSTVGEVMYCNDELLFEATYTFDRFGRRRVPGTEEIDDSERCILFFGGSFVFGGTCNDDETLPYYLSQRTPGVAVYNYGFGGYGPGQMLAQLESGEVAEQVGVDRQVTAVYVYISGHVTRVTGSMRVATQWGRYFPCYERTDNGDYVLKGSFQSARPVRMWIYDLLAQEQVMKFYKMDIPPTLTHRHMRFTAGLINAARKSFERQFESDRFYVLLYPQHPVGPPVDAIVPDLEALGVRCLNYRDLVDLNQEGFLVKIDRHPTGKAHAAIAPQLAADLGFTGEGTP